MPVLFNLLKPGPSGRVLALPLAMATLWALSACTPSGPNVLKFGDFAVVSMDKDEDTASLAEDFLGDADMDWAIEDYNANANPTPGTKLVIPLHPPGRGGVRSDAYQTIPVVRYTGINKGTFAQHMGFLDAKGYNVMRVKDLFDFMSDYKYTPKRSVVITIDSDDDDVYKSAFPILKAKGFPATVFVTGKNLGKKGHLNAKQIKDMVAAGVDVQCSSNSGADLSRPSGKENFAKYVARLQKEIDATKSVVKKFGGSCNLMAYPGGNTSPFLVSQLKKEGFDGGFTTQGGSNGFFVNPFFFYRNTVSQSADVGQFQRALISYSDKAL